MAHKREPGCTCSTGSVWHEDDCHITEFARTFGLPAPSPYKENPLVWLVRRLFDKRSRRKRPA